MQTDIPTLFVEINESNYIFVAGIHDDNQNFKIIEITVRFIRKNYVLKVFIR